MVVEVAGTGVNWSEPKDLDASTLTYPLGAAGGSSPGSHHPGGLNAALCDGSVRFISDSVPPQTFNALITKAVPAKVRGLAFGFFASSLGFISLPAPWLGGQLWDHFSPRIPFILTAMAALFGVWIAYTRFKLPENKSA